LDYAEQIKLARAACGGCRLKIPFKVVDGTLHHLDFFATPEAGAIGPCKCPEIIAQFYDGTDDLQNPKWRDEEAFYDAYHEDE